MLSNAARAEIASFSDTRLLRQTKLTPYHGKLCNFEFVMYEPQTESWSQQFLGDGNVCEIIGRLLHAQIYRIMERCGCPQQAGSATRFVKRDEH